MSIVLTRATKQAARYTDAGGRERCSGCRFFMPQGTCGRIIGPVSPKGWCRFFSQEAVQRWQPQGAQGIGGIGPSLDLGFMSSILDPRITFTRASTATYFDAAGTMQTAAINTPRFDYDPVTHAALGLLIEEQRTNVLLNTATLGTQSVAVTAQAYTLSFYGTGTITKSGTATGALVGTGAFPQRVFQTFTPTAGTLTLTVTGSVLNAQLEAGSFITSQIPTTAAAVTRAPDSCVIPPANMGFYVSPGGSWAAEFIDLTNTAAATPPIVGAPAASSGPLPLYIGATMQLGQWDGVAAPIGTSNSVTIGAVSKAASTATVSAGKMCLNGGTVANPTLSGGYPTLGTTGVGLLTPYTSGVNMSGYLRRVRYWPRVLSDAEMQSVTT